MKIKAIFFDLDGTLLPMDQDAFTKLYFKLLSLKLAKLGYDPNHLVDAIWTGTAAMVKNDGSCRNEEAFWKTFSSIYGEQVLNDLPHFDAFYRNEFSGAKAACGLNPKAAETIALAKSRGFRLVLATNPLFPAIATENRVAWAGLNLADFELYTTYENSCHCKPNPDYYRDILSHTGLDAEDCLMVGNDVDEDMIVSSLGMNVFLLTDCLINKKSADISAYPNGNFDDLMSFLRSLA